MNNLEQELRENFNADTLFIQLVDARLAEAEGLFRISHFDAALEKCYAAAEACAEIGSELRCTIATSKILALHKLVCKARANARGASRAHV
jgi:hypothetical protein